jgi:hypothetical protein
MIKQIQQQVFATVNFQQIHSLTFNMLTCIRKFYQSYHLQHIDTCSRKILMQPLLFKRLWSDILNVVHGLVFIVLFTADR